jgi:hypothetical protein
MGRCRESSRHLEGTFENLRNFLIQPALTYEAPPPSILRGIIGGSSFRY